jgi:hypothetical protein
MMARQHPSAPASVHESCDLSANFDDTVDGNRCVSVNLGAMSSKNSTQVLPCCRGWKGLWRVGPAASRIRRTNFQGISAYRL